MSEELHKVHIKIVGGSTIKAYTLLTSQPTLIVVQSIFNYSSYTDLLDLEVLR